MLPSPFISQPDSVSAIMLKVLLALLPGIALYVWYYGPAILVSITLASITALATEAAMLKLRDRPIKPFLSDNSALLTAWLLALSIPPLAPWWLVVLGTAFAISVAKHLYGGLGNNPFNPAMIGYAVLIVSFPSHMTHWLSPHGLGQAELGFADQLAFIFGGHLPSGMKLDAVTLATPLDTLKTQLHLDRPMKEILVMPIYGVLAGKGSEMVALGYILGGAYLLLKRIITWHIPAAFLGTLLVTAGIFHLVDPGHYAAPLFHLTAGASMLGAFFILTDPISGPTTPKGKLIFAAGAGILTYVIRVFGGFPDGMAFATLLMNICVPLIDAYTQPPVFGKKWGIREKRQGRKVSATPIKAPLQSALNLLVFAVIGTIVLAFTFNLTRDRIVKSVADEKLKLIMQIVPAALFDNDIIKDTLIIPASKQLGTDRPGTVYRARLQGRPSVVVLEAIAPDGYSGKIEMIVAIREDAALAGVRVVRHNETPGLGDYIEFAKNRWISLFDGASHARYKEGDWKVKKDGGQFDYMAGATITPRAMVKAVHKALHYYEENRDQLFAGANSVPQQEAKQ